MSSSEMPWSEKLSKALYYLRTVPNRVTNKTPAELLNGRRYKTAVSSVHSDSVPSNTKVQLEAAAYRTPTRTFAEDQPLLVRMYGPSEKWQRATVEMIEGPSSYRVRTEDGELHRRHADQILTRTVTPQVINQDPIADNRTARSPRSGTATPDMPIEIPPPELWPDIIGIPRTDQSNIL